MIDGADLDREVDRLRDDTRAELARFCSQPSMSAQSIGMDEMARMVVDALEGRGFSTRLVPTPRHPAIIAERKGASDRAILFYNHYDVQSPEPLESWESPPFSLTERDGKLFARGVMDDKGHLACRLAAIDAVLAAAGELPCTVKFLVEGEEEIASPDLGGIIRDNRDALRADLCLWEFGESEEDGTSMQYLGFRGLLSVELSVRTLDHDCHSGIWGSLLPNAAWRLTWALSGLKDIDERVTIPGFYDAVIPPSDSDMRLLEAIQPVPLTRAMGARAFVGQALTPAEQNRNAVLVPACTICGLTAGYQGSGQKTIVPSRASAKIDFRLVPDQNPDAILDGLRKHLDTQGFDDVEMTCLGRLLPSRTPADHPAVRMVVESARQVYGRPQIVYPMSGGSGPAHLFRSFLGVPVLTAGVGHLGSNIHAPNENIRVADFYNGIRHTARILATLGEGAAR